MQHRNLHASRLEVVIFEGFFDTHPNLKIIASHGGGTLPYLVGRDAHYFDNVRAFFCVAAPIDSPDGQRLAYSMRADTEQFMHELYVKNIEGTNVTRLITSTEGIWGIDW